MAGRPKKPTEEDRRLARTGLAKRAAGENPTKAESDAIRRVEWERECELRNKYYKTVPKADYVALSGRQHKTLNEQADRFGIPIGSGQDVIDLFTVIKWFHTFLATHKHVLGAETGDPLLDGCSQALKDEYVRAQIAEKWQKAELARLDRLEREGTLMDRVTGCEALRRIAGVLRAKTEALQRLFGPDAARVLDEGIDDAERVIDEVFGDPSDENEATANQKA